MCREKKLTMSSRVLSLEQNEITPGIPFTLNPPTRFYITEIKSLLTMGCGIQPLIITCGIQDRFISRLVLGSNEDRQSL